MLDIIQKEIEGYRTAEEKINRLREFLQILILKIIYDLGYFRDLTFEGGTALRILWDLERFSEDLDFSLTYKRDYSFHGLIASLKNQLKYYGLAVEIKKRHRKTVQNAMIKFKDILFKLGLSALKSQKLFVKIEIDANPPKGGNLDISLVNKAFVFTVNHFDLPSLYAKKLHACFFRKYIKGRDFYDLLWYLGRKIEPNFKLLNNAIKQTEGKSETINHDNFKSFLTEKLSNIDFNQAKKDIERFIVNKRELELFNRALILKLIK